MEDIANWPVTRLTCGLCTDSLVSKLQWPLFTDLGQGDRLSLSPPRQPDLLCVVRNQLSQTRAGSPSHCPKRQKLLVQYTSCISQRDIVLQCYKIKLCHGSDGQCHETRSESWRYTSTLETVVGLGSTSPSRRPEISSHDAHSVINY